MDIKKRIQELSLDQKAKLYFMGLVRQGKIDTLPEDPKAAYVSMMMDKDDYGRSISGKDKRTFMEPEDSMPAARARKLAGMEDDEMETRYDYDDPIFENLKEAASKLGYLNENMPKGVSDYDMLRSFQRDELLDDLGDIILKYVKDPDDAEAEVDRFDIGGFDNMSNVVTANLSRDPEYKAWAKKFSSLNEEETYQNLPRPDKVQISYTDPGFRFYGMYLHKDGKRFAKINFEDRATKYLKNLGIEGEIPRSYDESILDKIVAQLKEKGIDADHDVAMDVS